MLDQELVTSTHKVPLVIDGHVVAYYKVVDQRSSSLTSVISYLTLIDVLLAVPKLTSGSRVDLSE